MDMIRSSTTLAKGWNGCGRSCSHDDL